MGDLEYYNSLLSLVCKQTISPEYLRVLTDKYKTEIKSVRRIDAVASIRDLVMVLKKRACIDSENFSELEKIAGLLGLPLPSKTNPLRSFTPLVQPQERPQIPEVRQNNSRIHEDILPPPVADAKTRVYNLIAYRIGDKWKTFARSLGLLEGDLDALETKYKEVADRVFKVLYFFEQNCDRRQWKTHLLEALVTARRKDLKQQANFIFDTHVF